MRPLVAHGHLGLGALCRRVGTHERASEYFSIATALYQEMAMRFWSGQAQDEMQALETSKALDLTRASSSHTLPT
jgi:uncharacterized protein HemY